MINCDGYTIYTVHEYPWKKLRFKPLSRKPGETGKLVYADCVCAFDIETTRIEEREQAIMYVWQFAMGTDTVIMGRTWDDFHLLCHCLRERLGDMRLIVFVHNLSFEIQFLMGIYHFNDWDIFCTDSRKVLKAVMFKNIELRCSYKLTNLSLAALTKRYNKRFIKQSGEEYDYHKRRFPQTPLTDEEIKYCVYDVLALVESIQAILELNGEDLYTLPLTSTGFVRKAVKAAMQPYRLEMQDTYPPYRCYQLLKSAFRGGNTHSNRFYSSDIVENVTSMDISSSYPSQQCNKLFPVSQFKQRNDTSIAHYEKLVSCNAAVIMRVSFYDIALKDKYAPVPYIPIAKCMTLVYPDDIRRGICVDNGRVLQATYIEMCVTDIDFRIIDEMYTWGKMAIEEMYSSWYGYLPLPIREKNIEYFKKKTELKGVQGQELYYFKNKELLNSIYGMSVQDVVKQNILLNDTGDERGLYIIDDRKSREEIYNSRRNSVFSQFCYGCWTTCRARESLQWAINACGDRLVYCDTDSVKYVGETDFFAYNAEQIAASIKSGLYATDPQGVTHYGGVYEFDGFAKRFVTLGAKKYAYEDENGKLHITVSGVSKKQGSIELAEHGGLEAFQPGFIFQNSGKTECVYNDEKRPVVTKIDGNMVVITRNVVIRETTYTLGVTDDYADLLNVSSNMLNKVHRFWMNLQLQ